MFDSDVTFKIAFGSAWMLTLIDTLFQSELLLCGLSLQMDCSYLVYIHKCNILSTYDFYLKKLAWFFSKKIDF